MLNRLQLWMVKLHDRVGYHKAAVAIANKHARQVWAMLSRGEPSRCKSGHRCATSSAVARDCIDKGGIAALHLHHFAIDLYFAHYQSQVLLGKGRVATELCFQCPAKSLYLTRIEQLEQHFALAFQPGNLN